MEQNKNLISLVKLPYWLGILADALWAVGLFFPAVFSILIGEPDFDPDFQTRLIMAIGGVLMTGWTIMLIWGVMDPFSRRFVILGAALMVFGMFVVALIGMVEGGSTNTWIIIKTSILFVLMMFSYFLAGKMEKAVN